MRLPAGKFMFLRCRRHIARRSLSLTATTTTTANERVKAELRDVFRRTVQPVAVVTALLPGNLETPLHGATLSSFTSVAMEPYPLVSFSLIRPSRLSHALKAPDASFVVNLLSGGQEDVAHAFSRPGLFPTPLHSGNIEYTLTKEGLPVVKGALAALSCLLVAPPIPLHDLDALRRLGETEDGPPSASELFIGRVVRVEGEGEGMRRTPLLYRNRAYASVQ